MAAWDSDPIRDILVVKEVLNDVMGPWAHHIVKDLYNIGSRVGRACISSNTSYPMSSHMVLR